MIFVCARTTSLLAESLESDFPRRDSIQVLLDRRGVCNSEELRFLLNFGKKIDD